MEHKNIASMMDDRGKTHGKFSEGSKICQALKEVVRSSPNWSRLHADQREALEMICHKMQRILGGDPDHADHWDDIAGYALLIPQRLKETEERDRTHASIDAQRNGGA